ncbi:hypothetical protein AB6E94_18985 [Vibrio lentus]|uniref:hypothetical protein n=1 Tax=Vibrio TaxID=662 RepID=UPI000C8618A0|nr:MULTISPECIES: hypothetical protein [Vibrio]MCC4838124.1 hypothetical protein [Vibrio lentus]PMG17788.1 hypothetical protein BCU98_00200 [Vibrio splendidus]
MTLIDKLMKLGYEADHLDDVVDKAASAQASRINNDGMKEQLYFLAQQGYTEPEIIAMIENQH